MGTELDAVNILVSGEFLSMAITDRGLPVVDPHTALTNLIESNMASPDGSWAPVVNNGWLEYKKQKTFQICIHPLIGSTEEAQFGIGTQMARTSLIWMRLTLFAPNRSGCWSMMEKFVAMMNNGTLTFPAAGIEVATGNGYQYARITRSDESKPLRMLEPECGPEGSKQDKCVGYRSDYTIELRWGE